MAVRMSVGSVVGGIAAEITGGDFADGAAQGVWTSAFAYVVQALTGGGATHKEVEKELPESWRGHAVLEGVDREVALGGLGASTSKNQAVADNAETALTTDITIPAMEFDSECCIKAIAWHEECMSAIKLLKPFCYLSTISISRGTGGKYTLVPRTSILGYLCEKFDARAEEGCYNECLRRLERCFKYDQ